MILRFESIRIEVPDGSLVAIMPPAGKVARPRMKVPPGTTVEDVLDNFWRKKPRENGKQVR